MKKPVLAVVGPTASGKSALGLAIARRFNGEIVCMDSMQIYRGMDIGTAKPTLEEQATIPHHMLDIVEPADTFSVSQYAQRVEPVLHEIESRGKRAILVGGTGLYLRALTQGLSLGGAEADEALRAKLHAMEAEPSGKERLHDWLKAVDPQTAERLHPNDVRRVIRAIEVYETTGTPLSQQERASVPDMPFNFKLIGCTMERERLYEKINQRVDRMLEAGLMDEVEGLLKAGVSPACQSMQGIGYKELVPCFQGRLSLEDAAVLLKRNTRHYAKRQWTWFKGERDVRWVDVSQAEGQKEALEAAEGFWRECGEGKEL